MEGDSFAPPSFPEIMAQIEAPQENSRGPVDETEGCMNDGSSNKTPTDNVGSCSTYSYSFCGKGTVGLFKRTDGSPWKPKHSVDTHYYAGGDKPIEAEDKCRWEPIGDGHSLAAHEIVSPVKTAYSEPRVPLMKMSSPLAVTEEHKNTWVEVPNYSLKPPSDANTGDVKADPKEAPLDLALSANTKFKVQLTDLKDKTEVLTVGDAPQDLKPNTPSMISEILLQPNTPHAKFKDVELKDICKIDEAGSVLDEVTEELMKVSDDMEDELIEDEDEEDEDEIAGELQAHKPKHAITGRGVTLSMLMADGTIKPGENTMSIEYLGQKFDADLLPGGKIRWPEQKKVFGSPSAWAIHCKKIVNPGKKSGCGWASVKYKGKKLDAWKSSWLRKKRPLALAAMGCVGTEAEEDLSEDAEMDDVDDRDSSKDNKPEVPTPVPEPSKATQPRGGIDGVTLQKVMPRRPSVRHATLGRKSSHHDGSMLVDTVPFAMIAKLQPFHMTVTSSCLLLMDFHSHMTKSEVIGYLGGKWDANTQLLTLSHAFPCLCPPNDAHQAAAVEEEIRLTMSKLGVTLGGWYHSHPTYQPDPSLRDLELQMEYQYQLKGVNNSYQPCIGAIMSPYDAHSCKMESSLQAFWIMPPPEHRPLDYGMPMMLEYSISQDTVTSNEVLAQMKNVWSYYRSASDVVIFSDLWYMSDTYLDKLKASLSKRFQGSHSNSGLLEHIEVLLGAS